MRTVEYNKKKFNIEEVDIDGAVAPEKIFFINDVPFSFIYVEGSGSVKSQWAAKYITTQEQWSVITGKNPSHFKGATRPVESITWLETVDYINILSKIVLGAEQDVYTIHYDKNNEVKGFTYNYEGIEKPHFKLPTSEEWVWAAKGGKFSKGYEFAGSNNLKEVGWYSDNSGGETHPVGQLKHNELNISDMSGNVLIPAPSL